MKILILGSGGREHAIAWKLSQSKKVSKIFIGPGNAGTSAHGINLKIDPEKLSLVLKRPLLMGYTIFFLLTIF
jgi:phosphoribosylamine--glycine ligase